MTAPTQSRWTTDPDDVDDDDELELEELLDDDDGLEDQQDDDDWDGALVDEHVLAADPVPDAVIERPIVAPWLQSPRAAGRELGYLLDAYGRDVAYHMARVAGQVYWLRLSAWSFVTLARGVAAVARFLIDPASRADLAMARARAGEGGAYGHVVDARAVRRWSIQLRWAIVAISAATVTVTARTFIPTVPWPWLAFAAYVTPPALGWVAWAQREGDHQLIGRRTKTLWQEPMTADNIVRALAGLGISHLTRSIEESDGKSVSFHGEVCRTLTDTGWSVELALPQGIAAARIVARKGDLAAGLHRPESCVYVEPLPQKPANWLRLYVADDPLGSRPPAPWPWLRDGALNFFEPMIIGQDEQGEPVSVSLFEAGILIGAMPGAGKTWTQRLIAAGAALDPRTELHIWNYKGGADWSAFKKIAHWYGSSARVDDIAPLMLRDLKALSAELERRQEVIEAEFDRSQSEKLTDELASARHLGLHPIVLFIDEYHWAFIHPKWGPMFQALIEDLVRRGRNVGIVVCLATQKPSARSTPTDLRDNISLRIALRMVSQTAHEMVLGAGAWKEGWRTSKFPKRARGLALVAGEDDVPKIVQVSTLTGHDIVQIVERALKRRTQLGLLTGMAAGQVLEPDDETSATVIEDLVSVWPTDMAGASKRSDRKKQRVSTAAAVDLLSRHDPARYADWATGQLTMAMGPFEPADTKARRLTDPKHCDGKTQRSIDYDELLAALDRWLASGAEFDDLAYDGEDEAERGEFDGSMVDLDDVEVGERAGVA